jgi:glycosyltransferase involved in cell wall biosynthesis
VAAEAGIQFVMDLRDPWSLVERLAETFASPVWYRQARRFERQAVAGASLIAMNSESARAAMCRTYPSLADRIVTIMNGYDETAPVHVPARAARFVMVFAGSIYLDRDPGLLLRAGGRMVRELALAPADFRIEFVGNVGSLDPDDPSSLMGLARAEGLADYVGISGFRPRRELAALLAGATVLVSLYQDSKMAIPSKIFEYMQYDAWILTFAEPGSATELLLRESDADVVAPQDLEGLIQTLMRRYQRFRGGERPVRLARYPRFSRRAQANLLFDRLEALPGVSPAPLRSIPAALPR